MKQSIDRIPTTGNFTSRRLIASLAAAGALLSTTACADEISGAPTSTVSTEATPTTPEKLPESFTKERERAKETALEVADHLLDLMEDPRSHTETLDTGVEGIANKRYVSDHYPNNVTPELRALYYPDTGALHILGVDVEKQDDEDIIDTASATFHVGGESGIALGENLGHLNVADIRAAVFAGDTELISLSGKDKWGFSAKSGEFGEVSGVFYKDPATTGELTDQFVFSFDGDSETIVEPATNGTLITEKTSQAIDIASRGSENLSID